MQTKKGTDSLRISRIPQRNGQLGISAHPTRFNFKFVICFDHTIWRTCNLFSATLVQTASRFVLVSSISFVMGNSLMKIWVRRTMSPQQHTLGDVLPWACWDSNHQNSTQYTYEIDLGDSGKAFAGISALRVRWIISPGQTPCHRICLLRGIGSCA